MDTIFIARQVIERARKQKVSLNYNFIDFNTTFDTIGLKVLWKILQWIRTSKGY